MFRNLRNPQKKCDLFRRELPDDAKLHQFAREREFIERTTEVGGRPVKIPDDVVDTESNLTPIVLKKNLYRLGLPHNQFQAHEGEIHQLLNFRNGVAHGDLKDGIEEIAYMRLRAATFAIMSGLGTGIMKALTEKAYSRV